MSTGRLKVGQVKLGDNADNSKNFVIKVPAVADGTLTIERENGTDVLTIDAGGKVTCTLADNLLPLGVGQTWQDVTASRALGTDYTNNTGRPIEVFVTGNGTAVAGSSGVVVIGGVSMGIFGNYGSSAKSGITFTVPAGTTYRVNAGSNFELYQWAELR